MKELREYAQLSNWLPDSGDKLRIYELAVAGASREQAHEVMGVSRNHFNVVYKMLKEDFTEQVLVSPLNGVPQKIRLRHGIRKQYTTAMLMLRLGNHHSGIPLARATMRKAEKYGMFQIALDLSRELRSYYGPTAPNKKYYEYYSSRQKSLLNELLRELEAEDVFFDLGYTLKKGHTTNEIEERLMALSEGSANSYQYHYMRLLGRVILLQSAGKEEEMLKACADALIYFEEYDDLPYVVRHSFRYRSIAVHIARGGFDQAERVINKCLEDPTTGQHNWQIIQFLRALLGFHSGKPAIAFDAWNKAMKMPKKYRIEEMQERWLIIEAYLVLQDFELKKKFRLGRFLNSLPISTADKTGQHVTVIILELLHLLKAGNLERFTIRAGHLDKYIHEHLRKKKELARIIHFLRLLQCIVRGGFQTKEIEEKAKPYLIELENTTPQISTETIEIIPFKRCWHMALSWL